MYDEIKKRVRKEGGVTVVTLEELRKELGIKRLGKNVLETIREELRKSGLDYYPPCGVLDFNDQPRGWQEVRVFEVDTGSPISGIVRAVKDPSPAGDDQVRGLLSDRAAATASEIADRLERVRAAVEDAMAILAEADQAQE